MKSMKKKKVLRKIMPKKKTLMLRIRKKQLECIRYIIRKDGLENFAEDIQNKARAE